MLGIWRMRDRGRHERLFITGGHRLALLLVHVIAVLNIVHMLLLIKSKTAL